MGKIYKYEFKDPEFGEDCPAIPDGATPYERQEANRYWRNAQQELIEVMQGAAEIVSVLSTEGARPGATIWLAGASHKLTSGTASAAHLESILNGIHHRLSCEQRAAEKLAEYVNGLSS